MIVVRHDPHARAVIGPKESREACHVGYSRTPVHYLLSPTASPEERCDWSKGIAEICHVGYRTETGTLLVCGHGGGGLQFSNNLLERRDELEQESLKPSAYKQAGSTCTVTPPWQLSWPS